MFVFWFEVFFIIVVLIVEEIDYIVGYRFLDVIVNGLFKDFNFIFNV